MAKVAWIIFVIILPYLGVFVYLIAEHNGMTERSIRQQEAAKSEMDQYVKLGRRPERPGLADRERQGAARQGRDQRRPSSTQIKQKALAG